MLLFSISDVLLKEGNMQIQSTLQGLFQSEFWTAFFSNFLIIFSFVLAFSSKIAMGFVLARNPLAYSEGIFLGLSTLIIFIFGIILFNETLNLTKLVGIFLLITGIIVIHLPNNEDNNLD